MSVCGSCHKWKNHKFCNECGGTVFPANKCSRCNFLANDNSRYCTNCGGTILRALATGVVEPVEFFKATVRPSEVAAGVNKGVEESLSRFQVAPGDEKVSEEEAAFIAKYKVSRLNAQNQQSQNPVQNTVSSPQKTAPSQKPSDLLRGHSAPQPSTSGPWGSKYSQPPAYQQQPPQQIQQPRVQSYHRPGVVENESTVVPSEAFSKKGSDLDKYRIKEVNWEVYLIDIPATPTHPVKLENDGKLVFSSDGENGKINCIVSVKGQDDAVFHLKIPAVNFNLLRDLKSSAGTYISFSVQSNELNFQQQSSPFS